MLHGLYMQCVKDFIHLKKNAEHFGPLFEQIAKLDSARFQIKIDWDITIENSDWMIRQLLYNFQL